MVCSVFLKPVAIDQVFTSAKTIFYVQQSETGMHISLRGQFSLQRDLTVPPLIPMCVRDNSLPSGDIHYVTYYCAALVSSL